MASAEFFHLDPTPDTPMAFFDCGYRNTTDRMVIVRCLGPESFFLERVVFPFELLSFQCPPSSDVEIWTHGLGGPELLESFPSQQLHLESPTSITEMADHRLEVPWLRAV